MSKGEALVCHPLAVPGEGGETRRIVKEQGARGAPPYASTHRANLMIVKASAMRMNIGYELSNVDGISFLTSGHLFYMRIF